jgi:hypothetical protein
MVRRRLQANRWYRNRRRVASALKVRPDKSDRPFVVIFLTDGLPTVGTRNPEEIVANIKKATAFGSFHSG